MWRSTLDAPGTAALLLMFVTASGTAKDGPPSAEPSQLYEQFCGTCHDHPHAG